jgi:THO complex subunit 5
MAIPIRPEANPNTSSKPTPTHDSEQQQQQHLPPPPSPPDYIFDQLHALVSPENHTLSPTAVQVRASALFARLKAVNRDVNASVRDRKQMTSNARLEMDHMHLGLQNLLYEKRHLEREIEKCRQFA